AALHVDEAVPLLAAHLGDHETPEPLLKELVTALATLGGPVAMRALADFLLQYHADAELAANPAALDLAGAAPVHDGGVEARRAATYVAEDARTLAPVARQLRAALAAAAAAEVDRRDKKEPQSAPEHVE